MLKHSKITVCGTKFSQWTIYSATTFLENCRKVVREIWFKKSGSRKAVDLNKRWFYTINPPFFMLEKSGWPEKKIRVCRATFLEPLFYTFLEKWLQIKWSTLFPSKLFFLLSRFSCLQSRPPSKYAWVFKRALIKVTWLASNSNSTGKKM